MNPDMTLDIGRTPNNIEIIAAIALAVSENKQITFILIFIERNLL